MGLESKIREFFGNNKEFLIAAGAFIAANAIDYMMTVNGMSRISEGLIASDANPIVQGYIDALGPNGLLLYKSMMCTAVIGGLKIVDRAQKKRHDKEYEKRKGKRYGPISRFLFNIKPKHLLYAGAAYFTLAGCSWKYVDEIGHALESIKNYLF